MTVIIPSVLSTKQCHDYVGGSLIWNELKAKHPDLLPPLRTTPRGDSYYRRETVDRAINYAEASGSLLHQPNPVIIPIIPKSARRFKSPSTPNYATK